MPEALFICFAEDCTKKSVEKSENKINDYLQLNAKNSI